MSAFTIRIYSLKHEQGYIYIIIHMDLYVDIQTQVKDNSKFGLYDVYICPQSRNKMKENLKYSQLWLRK